MLLRLVMGCMCGCVRASDAEQSIVFKIDYKVDSINREFGTVFVGSENVSLAMVKKGLLKVRESRGTDAGNASLMELQAAEKDAKAAQMGMWSAAAAGTGIRSIAQVGDTTSFLARVRGAPMSAVVESVISGSTLRLTLLPSFEQVTIFLAGVQCPSLGKKTSASAIAKNDDSGADDAANANGSAAEPFAREAKYYSELKTLGRDVRVQFEGQDKYGNLFGALKYPEGNTPTDLAEGLCSVGVAKVADWSVGMVPGGAARLRACEKTAKDAKLRIWYGYVPTSNGSTAVENDKFKGVVVEVVSGDTLVVRDTKYEQDRRVVLSSIRAPRFGRVPGDSKSEPWGYDAKEFIRGRIIGADVQVTMDYSRKIAPRPAEGDAKAPAAASDGSTDKVMLFGTVTVNEKGETRNVAELLVARGFATVVKHRGDDERSPHYDDLIAAEVRAQKNKKGLHSSKEPSVPNFVDLSRGGKEKGEGNVAKRAKELLPFLQQKTVHTAIVDYVLSGHRLKLLLPKENSFIAFSLSGVRCPGQGEPFSNEAMAFTRFQCLQREVEVEFEAVDKSGGFLGNVRVGRTNLAQELVRKGLAKVHGGFAMGTLGIAETEAKASKRGIWESYDENKEKEAAASEEEAQAKTYEMTGSISHIDDASSFYFQQKEQEGTAAIEEALRALSVKGKGVALADPSVGKICAGRFTYDDNWYRAKINKSLEGGAQFDVTFVDFGNGEVLPADRLQLLSPGVDSIAPQAALCTLAFVRVPSLEEEYGHEAATLFHELCNGVELRAKVEYSERVDGGRAKSKGGKGDAGKMKLFVTLFLPSGTNVNEQLVKDGYARIEKRKTTRNFEAIEAMTPLQEHAKTMRLGMWEYGDVDDDDDYPTPPPPARRR